MCVCLCVCVCVCVLECASVSVCTVHVSVCVKHPVGICIPCCNSLLICCSGDEPAVVKALSFRFPGTVCVCVCVCV